MKQEQTCRQVLLDESYRDASSFKLSSVRVAIVYSPCSLQLTVVVMVKQLLRIAFLHSVVFRSVVESVSCMIIFGR